MKLTRSCRSSCSAGLGGYVSRSRCFCDHFDDFCPGYMSHCSAAATKNTVANPITRHPWHNRMLQALILLRRDVQESSASTTRQIVGSSRASSLLRSSAGCWQCPNNTSAARPTAGSSPCLSVIITDSACRPLGVTDTCCS